MRLIQLTAEALRSLAMNRLRSCLAMLGILIGIMSIALLLEVGSSMRRFVSAELAQLGTNLVYIEPLDPGEAKGRHGAPRGTPTLPAGDIAALLQSGALRAAAPLLQQPAIATARDQGASVSVQGTTVAMAGIRQWVVDSGEMFTEHDDKAAAQVAVIGKGLADRLFGNGAAVGRTIRIRAMPFTVVGVVRESGRQLDGNGADTVVLPLRIYRATLGGALAPDAVQLIVGRTRSSELTDSVKEELKDALRDAHRLGYDAPDDFQVQDLASLAASARTISAAISGFLALIGAISLVVGGIGIMNIMLVAVSERTREIGIRLAIGARQRDILAQFLVEAIAICLLAAGGGVALALLAAQAICAFGKLDVSIGPASAAFSCVFASAIGLVFGYYPARRASRLQPAECLRQD